MSDIDKLVVVLCYMELVTLDSGICSFHSILMLYTFPDVVKLVK